MRSIIRWLFGPRYPEVRRVIINLKSGTALKGLLYKHLDQYIVLREAVLYQATGKPVGQAPAAVDGEVLVRQADVDFIQVVS